VYLLQYINRTIQQTKPQNATPEIFFWRCVTYTAMSNVTNNRFKLLGKYQLLVHLGVLSETLFEFCKVPSTQGITFIQQKTKIEK
jgi:hypothetical protein